MVSERVYIRDKESGALFAYERGKQALLLHDQAARVLLLGRFVEHLALGAQVRTFGHEVIQLLATL